MSNSQKPPGCENIDGDQLASLKALTSDDMKTLINSHAGDKCKNELNNSLQTAVDRGSTTATWIEQHASGSASGGWSGGSVSADVGGSAGRNTTNVDRIDENNQTSAITEGCRQTLYNMNDSNTLYSQLACNIKTSTNSVSSKIKMGASISIVVGPTEEMTAAHERNIAGINANILALTTKNPPGSNDVKYGEQMRQDKQDAYNNFRFDITNSRFSITNNNIQTLINTNNQAIDDDTTIKEAITKKAVGEAVSAITQKYEMGAGAVANLESYAGTKINDTSLTTAMDIISAANDTKIESDQQGNLTLRINGSLVGVNVDITQGNLTELRSELIMKAATNLGRDISNDIIHEVMTKTTAQLEATGLASFQKAIADGLAAQAKALEQPDMFGGMFGGMFGKIAMIAIPIIIILVLFSMFGFKIALVAGLIVGIYLAIAYFVGLPPFSKEKNEGVHFRGVFVDLTSDEDYQGWLDRTVVPRREAYLTASGYPMAGGMAMDTQQAYGTVGQGYPMAGGMAMDIQRAYGTVGQGYPMADSQQTSSLVSYVDGPDGLATQARAQPLQKGYTNTHKKSGHHKRVSKKSMYNDIKALSNVGGEMRVSRMVQSEYSRKNRYSVKPLYNKTPEFKPK